MIENGRVVRAIHCACFLNNLKQVSRIQLSNRGGQPTGMLALSADKNKKYSRVTAVYIVEVK